MVTDCGAPCYRRVVKLLNLTGIHPVKTRSKHRQSLRTTLKLENKTHHLDAAELRENEPIILYATMGFLPRTLPEHRYFLIEGAQDIAPNILSMPGTDAMVCVTTMQSRVSNTPPNRSWVVAIVFLNQ